MPVSSACSPDVTAGSYSAASSMISARATLIQKRGRLHQGERPSIDRAFGLSRAALHETSCPEPPSYQC